MFKRFVRNLRYSAGLVGSLALLALLGSSGCGSGQNSELDRYFDQAASIIQEHYDSYRDAFESAGSPDLEDELNRQANIRSQTDVMAEMAKINAISAELVASLTISYTNFQNANPPLEAKTFNDLVLQMMQLRIDGWGSRYQESARYIRSGTANEALLRRVNEDSRTADLLWSEAKAEAIKLGRSEIRKVTVP